MSRCSSAADVRRVAANLERTQLASTRPVVWRLRYSPLADNAGAWPTTSSYIVKSTIGSFGIWARSSIAASTPFIRGHCQVQNHEIRFQCHRFFDCVYAINGFATNLKPQLAF